MSINNILNIEFPRHIALKMKSSIEFSTIINASKSINEIRVQNWNYPRIKFEISSIQISNQEYQDLRNIFYISQGRLNGFLVYDFTDYKIENQILGIGDGSITIFQIIKNYNFENYTFARNIFFPVIESIQVFLDFSVTTGFAVENGQIIFQNPPNKDQVITISCSFLVPVRFDNDIFSAKIGSQSSRIIDTITMVEIKS